MRAVCPGIAQTNRPEARGQVLGLTNVKFVLGTDRDPKLPADTVDAVLVLDTYHHFDYPEAMLAHIRDSLLSDGRLVIVDYYKRPDAMPGGRAMEHIRLDEDDVIKEVEANGFRLSSKKELIPKHQYLAIFVKNPYLRGMISGLGVMNVLFALEAFRRRTSTVVTRT